MFDSLIEFNRWLGKCKSIQYVVTECHPQGTLYFPAVTQKRAAKIATESVAHSDSVEVAYRTGAVYADIKRGVITKDADTEPEASYFAKVLANALEEAQCMASGKQR